MEKVRLGIIGCGNMGTGHIKNIFAGKCPEVEVTAVADLAPEKLDKVRSMWKGATEAGSSITEPKYFNSGDGLLSSCEADAVIIAIPHYYHAEYAIKAFRAGKHVMCEKPASVYTLAAREMIAEADARPELVFGMMFNQRTNCVYRRMREIIKSGELGEIRRTSWIITDWYRPQYYYDSGAWRATWSGEGGGVLLNQCPHNLDLWQWICGMPKSVGARMHFGMAQYRGRGRRHGLLRIPERRDRHVHHLDR